MDDSSEDAALVLHMLKRGGREVVSERVDTATGLREALDHPWDVVISDWAMPSFSGEEALQMVKARRLETPFIIISGTVTEETAVRAMRAGARDCVLKDKLVRLLPAVERELKEHADRNRAWLERRDMSYQPKALEESQELRHAHHRRA